MNACLQGGGADAAVYVNTGVEMDGSDAGARPEEAVSWGKLKVGGLSVKVWADATIVWPLIVAATWARVPEKGEEKREIQRDGAGEKEATHE
ncbi:Deoxyhypusine synthase [Bacidia gigantensis]|uniref:Deoxyhypusine synthase n=1 Tax=Bacidia gigantensis TaxID=2732470 RepID=UPI001D04DDE8|nr:Deoxyhypusine synthase [Bacidia gigantensis]KAG8526194.1 Deoxyhypusine synthase [Bacidia gigantensis]